jgi:phosphohistidine phosphatase SixA
MPRLGLWGTAAAPFADFKDFERRLGKQGTAGLELIALSLKAHAYPCPYPCPYPC